MSVPSEDTSLLSVGGASAQTVNRTRRVVRERAEQLRAGRSAMRTLGPPLILSAALLLGLLSAAWAAASEYDVTATGLPDTPEGILMLLLWSVPLSATVLAIVWSRANSGTSSQQSAARRLR